MLGVELTQEEWILHSLVGIFIFALYVAVSPARVETFKEAHDNYFATTRN